MTPYATPRDPDFRPDADELRDWTAANRRARAAYATRDDELARAQLAHWRRLAAEAAKK